MDVRRAVSSDVNRLADIAVQAFAKDPIYARFFPYRSIYPHDYHASLARSYTLMLNTPGQAIIVGCVKETNPQRIQHEVVVGFATFVRYGPIPTRSQHRWNPDTWRMKLTRAYLWLTSLFTRDRSANTAVITSYTSQAAALRTAHGDTQYFEFRTLAVDPAYQRQGFGEGLVERCGVRAVQEDVVVYGDATATALPLYVRNGCKDIGSIHMAEQVVPGAEEMGVQGRFEALDVVVLRWDSSALKDLMKEHVDFEGEC